MKKIILICFLMLVFLGLSSNVKFEFDNTVYYGSFNKQANYANKLKISVGNVYVGRNLIIYPKQAINDMYFGYVFEVGDLKVSNTLGRDRDMYYRLDLNHKYFSTFSKKYFNGSLFGEFLLSHKWDNIYGAVGVYFVNNRKLLIYLKASIGIEKNIEIDDNISFNLYSELMMRGNKFRIMGGIKIIFIE